MTTAVSATEAARAFFREALAFVRSALLTDDPPALAGWAGPALPAPVPQPGPIAGRAGDLWSLADDLRAGRRSVADLADETSARIAAHGERLGAHEYVADIGAATAMLDEEARAGHWRGPLHGLPIVVKDVIDVASMPTTASSAAYPPRLAQREGVAVARLRAAGALFTGKATTHEFALGVTTPAARNPWDETRIPGGSSGGSAIALVTGMAAGSLGTDTRASIRVPAALSGTVGFKPSYGLVPCDEWVTLSWSMDHLAPMARSVRDVALLMDVLTAANGFTTGLPGTLAGRRLVWSEALVAGAEAGVRAAFAATLRAAAAAGALVEEAETPTAEDLTVANAAGMIVSRAEAAQYHDALGADLTRCTPETWGQLDEARSVTAMDYLRAQRLRASLRRRIEAALGPADALIMPTSKVVAPPRATAGDYLLILSETCIPWSFVDLPAISLPMGLVDGLPVGVQLVGRPHGDAALLALAQALEGTLPPLPAWQPVGGA